MALTATTGYKMIKVNDIPADQVPALIGPSVSVLQLARPALWSGLVMIELNWIASDADAHIIYLGFACMAAKGNLHYHANSTRQAYSYTLTLFPPFMHAQVNTDALISSTALLQCTEASSCCVSSLIQIYTSCSAPCQKCEGNFAQKAAVAKQ